MTQLLFIGPGTPTFIFYFWIVGEIHGALDSVVANIDEGIELVSVATSTSESVADTPPQERTATQESLNQVY